MRKRTEYQALRAAFRAAGTGAELARRLGITRQAVYKWAHRGVPAHMAARVEQATNGEVRREELRPDLYAQ